MNCPRCNELLTRAHLRDTIRCNDYVKNLVAFRTLTIPALPCPLCGLKLSKQHLDDNPRCDARIRSLSSFRILAGRDYDAGVKTGGRTPKLSACPNCEKEFGVVAMREHKKDGCKPKEKRKA